MDDVGLEFADAPTHAKHVARKAEKRHEVEANWTNRGPPEVSYTWLQRHDLDAHA
jgi:hypothetical protein